MITLPFHPFVAFFPHGTLSPRHRPVVDAIPPSPYPCPDGVAVDPGVAIPALPPQEEEVIHDTLDQGHHDLTAVSWGSSLPPRGTAHLVPDGDPRHRAVCVGLGYAVEVALLEAQVGHGREVRGPPPGLYGAEGDVVLIVALREGIEVLRGL